MASTVTRIQRAWNRKHKSAGEVMRLRIGGKRGYYVRVGESLFYLGKATAEAIDAVENDAWTVLPSQDSLL